MVAPRTVVTNTRAEHGFATGGDPIGPVLGAVAPVPQPRRKMRIGSAFEKDQHTLRLLSRQSGDGEGLGASWRGEAVRAGVVWGEHTLTFRPPTSPFGGTRNPASARGRA